MSNSSDEGLPEKDGGFHSELGAGYALDAGLDLYRMEREEYIKKVTAKFGLDFRKELDAVDKLAQELVSGIAALKWTNAQPALDSIAALIGDLESGNTRNLRVAALLEAMEYRTALELVEIALGARKRLLDLLFLLGPLDPGWRGAAFLKRVSRCYLFGLDPECVVMCRSTLEAVFEAEISNDLCIEKLRPRNRAGPDGDPMYGFCDRIVAARRAGMISDDIAEAAHEVRKAGRNAVHHWPAVPKNYENSLPVIEKTLEVIRAMESGL